MNREEWKNAGKKLLTGIFSHITDISQPVIMPRNETEITYPHKYAQGVWEPELEIAGIKLAE